MKKNLFSILMIILMLTSFSISATAFQGDMDEPPTKEQREKIRERISTLKMWKLTEALDLDEKTSTQLFPIINKYDKLRAETELSLRKGMRKLKRALKEERESKLKAILDELEQDHHALQRIADDEWNEMKRVLTVEQQAKLVIFKQEFDRNIRKIIAEARERRGGKRDGGPMRGDGPEEKP